MRKVLQGWRGGVTIGGKRINNLRYADDTLMLARSEEELTEIMRKLDRISREHGLTLNKKKTKIMIIDRNPANVGQIDGFEVVENFSYLGSLITNKGGCDEEIKLTRI